MLLYVGITDGHKENNERDENRQGVGKGMGYKVLASS